MNYSNVLEGNVSDVAEKFCRDVVFGYTDEITIHELSRFNAGIDYELAAALDSFNMLTYRAIVHIEDEEVIARIVGKDGGSIKHVRFMTCTTIHSPMIVDNVSNHLFTISGDDLSYVRKAILIILKQAVFFGQKLYDRLRCEDGEVLGEYYLEPAMVSAFMSHGCFPIVRLLELMQVKIVTPKSYHKKPTLNVIGQPSQVEKVLYNLNLRYEYVATLETKKKNQKFNRKRATFGFA